MKYNPDIHKRKSIRLKDYDYSKEGMYFITICTQNREHLFGKIVDETVRAGFSCPIKYTNIKCDEYVIMPNHIHLILQIIIDIKGRENPAPTLGNIM